MPALHVDKRIPEITGVDARAIPDTVLRSETPLVLRGLLADWPVVQAAQQSPEAVAQYLQRFERAGGPPVVATVGRRRSTAASFTTTRCRASISVARTCRWASR